MRNAKHAPTRELARYVIRAGVGVVGKRSAHAAARPRRPGRNSRDHRVFDPSVPAVVRAVRAAVAAAGLCLLLSWILVPQKAQASAAKPVRSTRRGLR